MTMIAVAMIFIATPMICREEMPLFKIMISITRLPMRQMAFGTVFKMTMGTLLESIVLKNTMEAHTAPTRPPKR